MNERENRVGLKGKRSEILCQNDDDDTEGELFVER